MTMFNHMQAGRISAWRFTREVLYPDIFQRLNEDGHEIPNDAVRQLLIEAIERRRLDFDWLVGFLGAYDRDGTFTRPRP